MTHLVSIGNSQGIRIPKILIKQAKLENTELSLKVVDNGLLITPVKKNRANWQIRCEALGQEPLDHEWLEADLVNDLMEW